MADDPVAIARALLAVTDSPILYVADLDAIAGTGHHFDLCRELDTTFPAVTLWIDAGFSNVTDCAFWLPLGATLVIRSESLATLGAWKDIHASFGRSVVLSLDFEGESLRGEGALLADPSFWPDRVIAIDLDRVGTGAGPDLDRLRSVIALAGDRAIFAAGGMRDIRDIEQAATAGASGVLLATALHSGAVTQNEIAVLQQQQRSQS